MCPEAQNTQNVKRGAKRSNLSLKAEVSCVFVMTYKEGYVQKFQAPEEDEAYARSRRRREGEYGGVVDDDKGRGLEGEVVVKTYMDTLDKCIKNANWGGNKPNCFYILIYKEWRLNVNAISINRNEKGFTKCIRRNNPELRTHECPRYLNKAWRDGEKSISRKINPVTQGLKHTFSLICNPVKQGETT
jgi:hypothetical protein